MKKWLILLLIALLSVTALAPVGASTPAELADLSRYFPSDSTHIFFSIRSDAEFLAVMDEFAATLGERLPELMPAGETLMDNLDELAQEFAGDEEATFEGIARPWLGDTIAIAIMDLDQSIITDREPKPTIAISITDRAEAEAFLDRLVNAQFSFTEFEKEETDDYTFYVSESAFGQSYLLYDDVLLMRETGDDASTMILEFESSLAENEAAQGTAARLPESSYNALLYINASPILSAAIEANLSEQDMGPLMQNLDLERLLSYVGPQVLGFTLLDGRTLVVDYANTLNNADELGENVITVDPINLDFARYIPTDAALAIHDKNLGPAILSRLTAIESIGDMADAMLPTFNPDRTREEDGLRVIDDSVVFFRQFFRGLTGMPLEDTIGWMTGDFVNYVQFEIYADRLYPNTGFIVENTDTEGVQAYLDGTLILAESLELDVLREGDTLVLPFIRTLLTAAEIPSTDRLDVLVGANDDMLVVGNRSGAEAALSDGDGVRGDALYQTASAYFLPETQTLWYLNVEAMRPALPLMRGEDADLDQLLDLISVFESGSVTATYTEAGEGLVRFALTLPE